MAYVPDGGDIILLQFDPASGTAMSGLHFGLVISRKVFNSLGLAMVCPVSQGAAHGARSFGTVVTLMGTGMHTQGAVHCHQLKSLDWRYRKAKFKEKAPQLVSDDLASRLESLLFG